MQLIVLGMHRSGTSVLARLLNMMGAYFGPEGISTGANKENPQGFWERRDVRELNDFVLFSVGCDWNKVADFKLNTLPEAVITEFRNRASNIVLEMDANRPWLLKEPRLCLLLELWKELLEVPVCIHIYRNPLEVAQSLYARNGIPVHTGIALWEKYNQSGLDASRDLPRFAVSHNSLMHAPELEVKYIYEQLLGFGVDGLHLPSKKEITSFVRNELYRERVDEDKLAQHLNSSQLQMFKAFSNGQILKNQNEYQLSEAGISILREYEQSVKSAQAAKEAQQEANKAEAELRKHAQREKELSQQLKQQVQAAKEAQQEANKVEAELRKQHAQHEKELLGLRDELTVAKDESSATKVQLFETEEELTVRTDELRNKEQTIRRLEAKVASEVLVASDAFKLAENHLKDVQQLGRWLHVVEFHLGSWRWRSGRVAIGTLARMLGKEGGGIDTDDINRVLTNFKSWKYTKGNLNIGELAVLADGEKENKNLDRHSLLIQSSGLFDTNWYLKKYPDVKDNDMDPIEHYVKFGSKEKRDPSPDFNTEWYLQNYPDVAKSGINPLEHYILYGREEFRLTKKPLLMLAPPVGFGEKIEIIVTVFNALSEVKKCLNSIKNRRDGFIVDVIVVNDGSDKQTTAWLNSFCESNDSFHLIEHGCNKGYTKALNSGLKASTAPYVIVLNSDTIVTRGWLSGLIRCINSDQKIGMVGPLSNAASWQNVPALYDASGNFAINALPSGMTPDDMAQAVAVASSRMYPRLPFVNGFCFMIRREVIDAIGIMDEENFPVGYGEENDYCIRAAEAGFELAIADDTYVFHAKSKSFGHDRRKELSKQGSDALKRKHTASKYNSLVEQIKNTELLDKVRAVLLDEIREMAANAGLADALLIKVLFLLPVSGGGGGAHSIVQEVTEMQRLGMSAKIAVHDRDLQSFVAMYRDIPSVSKLFVGFIPENLLWISKDYDVVVGTIFSSMDLVKHIVEVSPHILPAYYVQDYEPMFFPPESKNWHLARDSYSLVPNAVLFAKTYWIANVVEQKHGIMVHKVSPSLDHGVYRSVLRQRDGNIHVVAMIRPQTPRRGAERTMRLLSRLTKAYPKKISCRLFGCAEDDPRFQDLQRDFDYHNSGVLTRIEVASLLAASDIFIDLSDYQAFGRTALEAMACGCAVIVPVHGGTDEYAIDDVNAIVVDSFDEDECFKRLDALLRDDKKLRYMQREGLLTAADYSVNKAARSELALFGKFLPDHRKHYPVQVKPKLMLMPSRRNNGVPGGSGYVRILLTYGSTRVWQNWDISECAKNELPQPGSADMVIIQRDAGDIGLGQLKSWLKAWRAVGGKFIYEVDDDLLNIHGLRSRGVRGDIKELTQKVCWLAKEADGVTVSTPALRAKFMSLNPNVSLIPNLLDAEKWKLDESRQSCSGWLRKKNPNAIYIGYIGTATHDQDLEVIAAAMKRIEKEYGNKVEIEVIGGFQNISPLFGKRVGLPKNNEYLSFVDWLLKRVNWDIGVIPLLDDDFNKCKSNLKFLEYAALDLAIVCSDVESYRDIAEHEKNALVVKNTTEAWYAAVKDLIDNPKKRKGLARKARSDVMIEYTVEQNAEIYLAVLDKAANQ